MDGWKTRYTFLFGALPGDLFSEQNGILVLFWGKIMQNINDLIPKTPSVTSPAEVPSDPLKGPHWASLRGLRGSFTWRNMGFPHVVSHILWLHIDAAERHPKKNMERNWPLPNGNVHVLPPYITSSKRHHEGVKTGWPLSSHGHSHHRS